MADQTAPPLPTDERAQNIPAEMRAARQWITWAWGEVRANGKPTKPPTDYRTGRRADKTDPDVWTTFEEAYAAAKQRCHGIGFVCLNGWCGVDLDHCLSEGVPTREALEIISRLESYTERSPSGDGLHTFLKATLPDDVNTKTPFPFEMYSTSGGYLTVTGEVAAGYLLPVAERQTVAEELYYEFKAKAPMTPETGRVRARAAIVLSDEEIRRRILRSKKNGPRFEKLWAGNTSEQGGDDSAADMALCGLLAYYLGCDAERIDQWFQNSGLMREKWTQRHGAKTYGRMTIDKVISTRESTDHPLGFEIRNDAELWHVDVDRGKDGKSITDDEGRTKKIRTRVSTLFEIMGEARDENSTGWALVIRFRDRDQREGRMLLKRDLFEEPRELFKFLASRGVMIFPQKTKNAPTDLILKLLRHGSAVRRLRLVRTAGWHGDVFVLPDETFGNADEEFTIDSDLANMYITRGTLEDWRENVAKFCVGNSRLAFQLSCSFAGPLLRFVDGSVNPGFHFFGPSSYGKTTGLGVAASSCGSGNERTGYMTTWRATDNALEKVAASHNDSLLVLDELKQLEPKKVSEVTYMLGNGKGKARARKDMSLADQLSWQCVTLSSGEVSIEDYAKEAGKNLRAGQRVRMLDVPADAGKGLGAFEVLHGVSAVGNKPAAVVFADLLKKRVCENYGLAFRAFLKTITEEPEKYGREFRELVRAISARLARDAGSVGEVHRVVSHFAIIGAAGEIASRLGITGWAHGEAERAAEACFKAWFAHRGTAGSSDDNAMVSFVRLLIQRDGASRFQRINEDSDRAIVINRLGYKWKERGQSIFFFLPEPFAEECSKQGFDMEQVAKALQSNGLLVTNEANRLQYKKRTPDNNESPRGYAVLTPDDEDAVQMDLRRAA